MYELYIANKNYSSWSMRPWVLMRELELVFTEQLAPFGQEASWQALRKISPSGKVPCLMDAGTAVWDSLAIVEYLAEGHDTVWPAEPRARAWARSAAAEMHSGFGELRNRCAMSCGVRVRLNEMPRALMRDIDRMSELWNDGLHRFGGPFLAGRLFTGVDAFFAPVALRIQTYALTLSGAAAAYATRLLGLRSIQAWYADALRETMRDPDHDAHVLQLGTLLQDLRQR